MTSEPLKAIDCAGKALAIGDRVRIVGVPELPKAHPGYQEMFEVFTHLRGQVKKISGFDQYGHAEIFFGILRGKRSGYHGVAIEPFLLKKQM